MTTIYDFAAQLNASARANQFRVHINFPAGLVSNGVVAKTAATFLTSQASLPSYTTEDIPVWYRGRQIHEAGEKQYEQWTCTIYNSSDFAIRTALEEWVSAIRLVLRDHADVADLYGRRPRAFIYVVLNAVERDEGIVGQIVVRNENVVVGVGNRRVAA